MASTDILKKLMAEAMPGLDQMNDHELIILAINNIAVLNNQIQGDDGKSGLCGDLKSISEKIIRLEKSHIIIYVLIAILFGKALIPLFPLL
jgi:hypothetical protein